MISNLKLQTQRHDRIGQMRRSNKDIFRHTRSQKKFTYFTPFLRKLLEDVLYQNEEEKQNRESRT